MTTKEKLAQAIADVWSDVGPCAVTFRAVAERAGMSRSNVEYYYPTTEALRRAGALVLFDSSESNLFEEANCWLNRHGFEDAPK